MADTLLWIVGSAVVDALLGFVGVFSLWLSKQDMKRIANVLMAFAAGSLLGGAFIHLLPEALEESAPSDVLLYALAGFVLFIFLETYVHWHHCKECNIHPFSYTVMVGDGVHNFLGGLVLAASFIASVPLGIATLIAIIAHELPQQLGIFGVLVKGGFERNKAIIYSFICQATIIPGAIVGYLLAGSIGGIVPLLVPFAAGNFIYIAAADLIPEMHRSEGWRAFRNIGMFFLGIILMWALKLIG
jgi:zinc and cadmium transporter